MVTLRRWHKQPTDRTRPGVTMTGVAYIVYVILIIRQSTCAERELPS